jgi:MFS family permease
VYARRAARTPHPLLELALFRLRTFRAAVSGSFFTRVAIGGVPFLFPLLYQVGLGYTPVQSGLLMMPPALAAISLKVLTPRILARFGYRSVLIANTVLLGVLIALFSTIGAATPVWLIVLQAFAYGFVQSLQYTSMNTLVYADVGAASAAQASTIASTAQQLSMSFGVAIASLVAAVFVPGQLHTSPATMVHGVHQAFLLLGLATALSTVVFSALRPGDGSAMSQHRVARAPPEAPAALVDVPPPSP